MGKKLLNEVDFVAELNRRLAIHPEFVVGMEFLAHPLGATGHEMRGTNTASVDHGGVYNEVRHEVEAEFNVAITAHPKI